MADDDMNESNPFVKAGSFSLSVNWETQFNKLSLNGWLTGLPQLVKLSKLSLSWRGSYRSYCVSCSHVTNIDQWQMSFKATKCSKSKKYKKKRKKEWNCWPRVSSPQRSRTQISTRRGFATVSHICQAPTHTCIERTVVYCSWYVFALFQQSELL